MAGIKLGPGEFYRADGVTLKRFTGYATPDVVRRFEVFCFDRKVKPAHQLAVVIAEYLEQQKLAPSDS